MKFDKKTLHDQTIKEIEAGCKAKNIYKDDWQKGYAIGELNTLYLAGIITKDELDKYLMLIKISSSM